ncbi:hypothetical protein B0H16DRAFT_1595457 [Mycena metata]|uniref:Uncharacterized protein n=1 Tax=Mycena metata TaxID=1033252 RepID=A0AAD7HP16_9AGAR|nr:hypothetical protein B0H16DRAFT_1595457 [Mycena metata]
MLSGFRRSLVSVRPFASVSAASQVLARDARSSFGRVRSADIRGLRSPRNAHSSATAAKQPWPVIFWDASELIYPDEWDHESSQLPGDYNIVPALFKPQMLFPKKSQLWYRFCVAVGDGEYLPMTFLVCGAPASLYLSKKAFAILTEHGRIDRERRMQLPNGHSFEVDNGLNFIGNALALKLGLVRFPAAEYPPEVDWW